MLAAFMVLLDSKPWGGGDRSHKHRPVEVPRVSPHPNQAAELPEQSGSERHRVVVCAACDTSGRIPQALAVGGSTHAAGSVAVPQGEAEQRRVADLLVNRASLLGGDEQRRQRRIGQG